MKRLTNLLMIISMLILINGLAYGGYIEVRQYEVPLTSTIISTNVAGFVTIISDQKVYVDVIGTTATAVDIPLLANGSLMLNGRQPIGREYAILADSTTANINLLIEGN